MKISAPSGGSSGAGSFLPHIVLAVLAAVMIAVARAGHVTTEEAFATAFDETASTDDRIWGMHLAAGRATEFDRRLGVQLVNVFLASDDEKLREAAHLIDLCRHAVRPPGAPSTAAPPLQDAYAYGPLPGERWTAHRLRCLVLHRRKVGGSIVGGIRRMELAEVQWFLDSLAGKPGPLKTEMQRYFNQRALRAGGVPSQNPR